MPGNVEPIADDAGRTIPGVDSSEPNGNVASDGNSPRKRGRPAGSGAKRDSSPADRISPAALGDSGAGNIADPGTRKRGRKPGSPKEEQVSLDTLITAYSVAGISIMSATGIPEFLLSDTQTKTLAEATQKVTRHFPSVMTGKQQDIVALFMCISAIAFTQVRTHSARIAAQGGAPATNIRSV